MPKQIEQHWHRKSFKDFDYLEIELTDTQMWWVLIIVLLYNIGVSIWIVMNQFEGVEITGDSNNNTTKRLKSLLQRIKSKFIKTK
jgi:hypothetical protein